MNLVFLFQVLLESAKEFLVSVMLREVGICASISPCWHKVGKETSLDFACWLLRSEDRTRLDGVIMSHVDDLLLGGNRRAEKKLKEFGEELEFGSTSEKDITYCGKRIRQHDDGHITITMEGYHSSLKTVTIPVHRRAHPDSDLTEMERRQLRAILGSLQWLVAQLRFDSGFQLSTLQGEPPKISTLMKANLLVKRFQAGSRLCFDLQTYGIERCRSHGGD